MSSSVQVLVSAKPIPHLPDCAVPGASALLYLDHSGSLQTAADVVRVNRQGGFTAFDALIFMITFFANPTHRAFRRYSERIAGFFSDIAALAGRKTLPSTSSLSRLLGKISMAEVHAFRSWLLFDMPDVFSVLQRPDTLLRDRMQRGWHVVDFDPTVEGIRRRALPKGPDLPPASRRLTEIATPCRLGRKRGEAGIRTATLFHAGGGVWLHADVGSGTGVHNAQFLAGVRCAAQMRDRLGVDDDTPPVLMRADGEFGTVRSYTVCREHRISLITRTCRYSLLEQPEVVERMQSGQWERVPDSGSGPTRFALDLGLVEYRAKASTKDEHGEEFAPILVRTIVSRAVCVGDKRGCGHQIGDQNFELFAAVDVSPEAFSASDVPFLFYGRINHENNYRLARRDGILGHTYSANTPGQLFATLVALAMWNLDVVRGAASTLENEGLPLECGEPNTVPPLPPFHVTAPLQVEDVGTRTHEQALTDLQKAISGLDWQELLHTRKGWLWNESAGCLETDEGTHLHYRGLERRRSNTIRLRFRATSRSKQATVNIKGRSAATVLTLQVAVRRARSRKVPPPPPRPRTLLVQPSTNSSHRGHEPILPSFHPNEARKQHKARTAQMSLEVQVTLGKARTTRARTRFSRQHRRLTWTERLRYAALRADSTVTVTILGCSDALRSVIQSSKHELSTT